MGDFLLPSPMESLWHCALSFANGSAVGALVVQMDRPKRAGVTQLTFGVSNSMLLQVRALLVD